MLSHADLCRALSDIGLERGDSVLVHSALRRLGPVDGGADTVIDALLAVIGPEGLLAVPTHTFRSVGAKQPVFDQAHTASDVGALGNVCRQRSDAQRGLHPTHSLAAIGPRSAAFLEGHERDDSPCSARSPYARLASWGGKVLIIGVGLECCTIFHGCEEWAGVSGLLTTEGVALTSRAADGTEHHGRYRGHPVNTWDQYPRLEPHLRQAGWLRIGAIGACPLRLLDAQPACDWLVAQLREDPSLILP